MMVLRLKTEIIRPPGKLVKKLKEMVIYRNGPIIPDSPLFFQMQLIYSSIRQVIFLSDPKGVECIILVN